MTHKEECEIIIGLVAPLGTRKTDFEEILELQLRKQNFHVERIKLTEPLFEEGNKELEKINPNLKPFRRFLKMDYCNNLRGKGSNKISSIMACLAINEIVKIRNEIKNDHKKIVYIIDQLKNVAEYSLLSRVYGLSYVQLSLFSSQDNRINNLKNMFKPYFTDNDMKIEKDQFSDYLEQTLKKEPIKLSISDNYFLIEPKRYPKDHREIINRFEKEIHFNSVHQLIQKDFNETNGEDKNRGVGQQICDIFHRSHYFFNVDCIENNDLANEIKKFCKLLFGNHNELPTQHEFGMSLAFQGKPRSNFPGGRQIGAAILSKKGEVISVASIRAPSKHANTSNSDRDKIELGYKELKEKIENWYKKIVDIDKEAARFIKDSLEFHPCTHAEISAILDAAKQGISIRNSILYTTTFPCHLCAKEIVTAGISQVVYLEAYPKSKNEKLYKNIIDIDHTNSKYKIKFNFFVGVGPKRYGYVYSTENKKNNKEKKSVPNYLQYEHYRYFVQREKDILKEAACLINGRSSDDDLMFLDNLIKGSKDSD